MPSTPQQADDAIFAEALEMASPQARAAFLDQACAVDQAQRQRIETLLNSHDEAGNFLKEPLVAASASIAEASISEAPGTLIGRYKLLQQIGEGGFGNVYMAQQKEPVRRKVALKIIKLGMDSKEIIARFEAERQALALMDHPNIARVLDAGATQTGRPYFVMELVNGVAIGEFCDKNRLSTRARLELFIGVCQAVQHAHQKGVIHRDLKPSNILVTLHDGKPVPKVIDFGVAKALNQELTEKTLFTAYGHMVGTPQYMSPEQAELSGLDVDTRSDIYSLGVVLYELLTGTTPLEAKQLRHVAYAEMRRLIREEEAPRPSQRLSTLGERLSVVAQDRQCEPTQLQRLLRGELDWIVLKALEKDRARRYETANSLARDLQHYLADEPVEACPPTVGYRLRKFARKNRSLLMTAVSFAAVLLLGATVSTWQALLATQAEERANDNAHLADANAKQANVNELEAQQQAQKVKELNAELRSTLYAAQMNLASQAWEEARIDDFLFLLKQQHPKSGKDLRGFEWHYLNRLCHRDVLLTLKESGFADSVAFTPDGRRVITIGGEGFSPGKPGTWPNDRVTIWDAQTGKKLKKHIIAGGGPWPVLSPDCTLLATRSKADKTIKLWNVETGKLLHTLICGSDGGFGYGVMEFSLNGKRLASSCGRDVKIWDTNNGEELPTLKGQATCLDLAFSPDGELLAAAGGDWDTAKKMRGPVELVVWNVHTGKKDCLVEGHNRSLFHLIFSLDGKHLAAISSPTDVLPGKKASTDVNLWDVKTKELHTFKEPSGGFEIITFSPDGKFLAACGGIPVAPRINVWDTKTGKPTSAFHAHTSRITCLSFSPDSRRLVSGSDDRTLRIWDLDTGVEVRTLKGHRSAVAGLAFSPDGSRLVSTGGYADVKIWDAKKEEKLIRLEGGVMIFGNGETPLMPISPNYQYVAGVVGMKILKVWDAQTGKEIAPHKGFTMQPTCLAFSSDGQRIAGGDGDRSVFLLKPGKSVPGIVRVWNVGSGEKPLSLEGHPARVVGVAFSPDGTRLASASEDGIVKVWNAKTGDLLRTLKGKVPASPPFTISVAFSPKGERMAGAGKIWDTETGEELLTDIGEGQGVTFSPDGKRVASRTFAIDGAVIVKVWDAKSGQKLFEGKLSSEPLKSLTFSPDGQRLVTASRTKVKLWDSQTGAELLSLRVPVSLDRSVAFTPDGHQLACVSSNDGTIRIWDGTPLPENP
jgi:WD40 repeat protein/serine/threonine protein kinase